MALSILPLPLLLASDATEELSWQDFEALIPFRPPGLQVCLFAGLFYDIDLCRVLQGSGREVCSSSRACGMLHAPAHRAVEAIQVPSKPYIGFLNYPTKHFIKLGFQAW